MYQFVHRINGYEIWANLPKENGGKKTKTQLPYSVKEPSIFFFKKGPIFFFRQGI